jgi:hypothetical protein
LIYKTQGSELVMWWKRKGHSHTVKSHHHCPYFITLGLFTATELALEKSLSLSQLLELGEGKK